MFQRLYIHVPYCIKKCSYCAFNSASPEGDEVEQYPALLLNELQLHKAGEQPLDSIYFGGGTPSLLKPHHISMLLAAISDHIGIATNAEITLEVNPGTVEATSLKSLKEAGINRISLGVQSFDDNFLQCLGRIHSADKSIQAFRAARDAGFSNISLDLIHSLPLQSLDQWHSELDNAIKLSPEHLSIYGLTVEENTPFAHLYPPEHPDLAGEDLSADMFELADKMLTENGFEHYEIANYGKHGYHSQHNSGYWRRDGYLGLGVAAHSFLRDGNGIRFSNPDTLEEYSQTLHDGKLLRKDEVRLTRSDAMAEHLFLGLRLTNGIRLNAFEQEFGQSVASAYGPVITDLMKLGLIRQEENMLSLTPRGVLLSNQVFTRFLK